MVLRYGFALGLTDDVEILLVTRESQDQGARGQNSDISYFLRKIEKALLEVRPASRKDTRRGFAVNVCSQN